MLLGVFLDWPHPSQWQNPMCFLDSRCEMFLTVSWTSQTETWWGLNKNYGINEVISGGSGMCTLLEAKPASSQKRSSDASLMPSSTWRRAVVTCGEKHRKGDLKSGAWKNGGQLWINCCGWECKTMRVEAFLYIHWVGLYRLQMYHQMQVYIDIHPLNLNFSAT